jgi:predicted nucleic acid-binding protein
MPTNGYKALEDMEPNCVLLDTSFFIRLLHDQDPLHLNTLAYYRHFLENQYILKFSTISIAEYCVKGKLDELPLRDIQIVPFNINHAEKAGEFAATVFKNRSTLNLPDRRIIPNDTKLFAQADTEVQILQFATSDVECIKIFNLLKPEFNLKFDIINIRVPYHEHFGLLDLQ